MCVCVCVCGREVVWCVGGECGCLVVGCVKYIVWKWAWCRHTFSAFWLRSSVVSVLISVKTDMLNIV